MSATIQERLAENAKNSLLGREIELDILRRAMAEQAPVVIHLHGISGIGKSALLMAFGQEAAAGGASVLMIDCAAVEPTERGFLGELAAKLGCAASLETIAAVLCGLPVPLLLALDSYEAFGLLDSWLRVKALPTLPGRSLVILSSRLPPAHAWMKAPEWQGLFRPLSLGCLSNASARAMLARFGITEEQATHIQDFACGHPLALTLAGEAARSARVSAAVPQPIEAAIALLARRYLGEIPDSITRAALRAACVARRIDCGLLRALQLDPDSEALYERLASLPFAIMTREGIALHEAVREALSAELEAEDPEHHRQCRQAVWHYLRQAVQVALPAELWRYTADLIHLIQNPAVRKAFFPHDAAEVTLEPAQAENGPDIMRIAESHDRDSADCLRAWFEMAPHAFHVALGPDRNIEGFYCLLDAAEIPDALRNCDPVVTAFYRDLGERPLIGDTSALFLRRWLSRMEGEQPSAVQAACWLDIKRHYMERRPRLRRVYMVLAQPKAYLPAMRSLGIKRLSPPIAVGNASFEPFLLDMGEGSVDGWLLDVAAQEIGIASAGTVLDRARRSVNIWGRPVSLTRREFAVLDYLVARRNELVLRDNIIEHVWGTRFCPASNVVDAVVASLRRKLGIEAGLIETVRGFGYRCRIASDEPLFKR